MTWAEKADCLFNKQSLGCLAPNDAHDDVHENVKFDDSSEVLVNKKEKIMIYL